MSSYAPTAVSLLTAQMSSMVVWSIWPIVFLAELGRSASGMFVLRVAYGACVDVGGRVAVCLVTPDGERSRTAFLDPERIRGVKVVR